MLGHINVCVTDDALNGGKVYAKSLHLRHISMTAAVGCQHTDTGDLLQSLFEMIAEGSGVARCILLFHFPNKLGFRGAELDRIFSYALRYRNIAVAVSGLGCADHYCAFDHVDGLTDVDAGTVRFDVSWLQSEQFLRPHTSAEKQPNAPSNSVVGQQLHEGGDFLCGEAFLALYRAGLSHFLCEAHRVFANQIVCFSLVEYLIEHPSTLCKAGVRPSVAAELFQERLDVIGFYICDAPAGKALVQNAEGVAVVLLRGRRDVVPVVLEPDVRPFGELEVDIGDIMEFLSEEVEEV